MRPFNATILPFSGCTPSESFVVDKSEIILTSLAGILVLGVGSQWIAGRLKIPSILVLLCAGIVAGPVAGFINPD
jgi:Kef-type K+ transport system membrane component KefB